MTIEGLLERTLQLDNDAAVRPRWEDVASRVDTRAARRARMQRVGTVLFLAILGFAALNLGGAPAIETGDFTARADASAETLTRWPTSGDVSEKEASVRSAGEVWAIRAMALGIPALAAWLLWFAAPDSMRGRSRQSRVGRSVIAVTTGMLFSLALVAVLFVSALFFFDPVAFWTRSSTLTDALGTALVGLWLWVVAFAFLVMVPVERGPVRWVRSGWSWAVFLFGLTLVANLASVAMTEFRWEAISNVDVADTPIRGLLAPLFHRGLTFDQLGREVSASFVGWMFVLIVAVGAVVGWQAWIACRMAFGVEVRRWDRLSMSGLRAGLRGNAPAVGAIVLGLAIGVSYFGSMFLVHDQVADGVPIPDGYAITRAEVRKWSAVTDADSPLAVIYLHPIETSDEAPRDRMATALTDAGFDRRSTFRDFTWSLERDDRFDADLVRIDLADADQLVISATVFDTDGMLLALPVFVVSALLMLGGMWALGRRRPEPLEIGEVDWEESITSGWVPTTWTSARPRTAGAMALLALAMSLFGVLPALGLSWWEPDRSSVGFAFALLLGTWALSIGAFVCTGSNLGKLLGRTTVALVALQVALVIRALEAVDDLFTSYESTSGELTIGNYLATSLTAESPRGVLFDDVHRVADELALVGNMAPVFLAVPLVLASIASFPERRSAITWIIGVYVAVTGFVIVRFASISELLVAILD
ncbi:MAG: hypothetical protein ACI81L_003471 [Verrucomicrobiales bacterium]|jgi:hypothetical protein